MIFHRLTYFFVFSLVLFLSCIDLNDFDKITDSLEYETSVPLFESNYSMADLVQERIPSARISPSGIYYLENTSSTNTISITKYPFDYTLSFNDIVMGPYYDFTKRNDIQQRLYNSGFAQMTIIENVTLRSAAPNPNSQLRKVEIVKGSMRLRVTNSFQREARVQLTIGSLSSLGVTISVSYVLPPRSNKDDIIDLSNYTLSLDGGNIQYNQLSVLGSITISDPSAQGNASRSMIASSSEVKIESSIDIDEVSSIVGSVPYFIFINQSISSDISQILGGSNFLLSNPNTISIRPPVVTINTESDIYAPIYIKLQNLKGDLINGSSIPINFITSGNFYEISLPASDAANPTVKGSLIFDNTLVDQDALGKVVYNKDIQKLSMDAVFSISPIKASVKDSLAPANINYYTSVYLPLQIGMNDYITESVDYTGGQDFVSQLEKIFLKAGGKVSKVTLAITALNGIPLDFAPQYYLYRNGKLVDSLISAEQREEAVIPGAPIDQNGFVVRKAVPKTLFVEIEKKRWDRMKAATETVGYLRINSVKSAKTDYIYLQKDQTINFKFKIRDIVYTR